MAKYLLGASLLIGLFVFVAACGAAVVEVVAPVPQQVASDEALSSAAPDAESRPAEAEVVQVEAAETTSDAVAMSEAAPEKESEAMMEAKEAPAEAMAAPQTEAVVTEEKTDEAAQPMAENAAAQPAEGEAKEDTAMLNEAESVNPGPTEDQLKILASLPNNGPAPELQNDVWLNSEPLRLADLRGQVVIVDFWTFGCINCIRTIPAIRDIYNTYKDDGLVIIGVHTPEFGYEKELEGVKESLTRLDVPFPVTLDNDKLTWRTYANHYWPAQYLIDKSGNIRALYIGEVHIGDKRYNAYKQQIEALLAEQVF